jgi:hypothetical protein
LRAATSRPLAVGYEHLSEPCLIVEGHPHPRTGHITLSVDGQRWQAHRYVWTEAHGPIPAGLNVQHHCDVPDCVRLSHLYLGTHKDNARDRDERGRAGRSLGEANGASRLTREQADAIRAEYAAGGISQHVLADRYGVTAMTVNKIVRGRTWT